LARQRRDRDRLRRDLALHVERTATPDLAVTELAAERVELPLGGIGQHDVRVREKQHPRAVPTSRNARDEIRALGYARVQLARDAVLLEVVTQQLGGTRLVAGGIRRVDADELLQELRDFRAQRDGRHQRRRPIVSRYLRGMWM